MPYVVGEKNYGYIDHNEIKELYRNINEKHKNRVRIKNVLDNKEFNSINHAKRYYGISEDAIRRSMRENVIVKCRNRLTYKFERIV